MGILAVFYAGADKENQPGEYNDYMLINVANEGSTDAAIIRAKHFIQASNPKVVLLDSGGFQLFEAERLGKEIIIDKYKPIRYRGKLNLTSHHAIYAAKEIKPDIMVALDFPIKTLSDRAEQEHEFTKKLGYNVTWAIETAKQRQKYCPGVKLFIPIQCYDLEQLDFFINLIKGIKFDGFSMPVRNLKIKEIILFLIQFYKMGIREVHLLGTSSLFVIALAAYMAKILFDWFSFDSRTWWRQGANSQYLNPHDLSSESLRDGEIIIDEGIENDCECPWCKDMSFTAIKNMHYPVKLSLISCHNFWVTERAAKDLYEHADSPTTLRNYLRKKSRRTKDIEELYRCLCLVEAFKDSDIDKLKILL